MPRSHQSPEQLWFFNKLTSTDPVTPRTQESVTALLTETPPVINRARHGAGEADEAVKYVTLMENYYAHGKTKKDQEELTKAQNITIDKDTVTIAGLKIERKKSGKAKGKRALEEKEFLPTLEEWQMIIDALPGGREWHKSLQKILGIDIYEKSYWGWDSAKSTVIITRMSGLAESRKLNPKTSIDPDEEACLRFIVRGN